MFTHKNKYPIVLSCIKCPTLKNEIEKLKNQIENMNKRIHELEEQEKKIKCEDLEPESQAVDDFNRLMETLEDTDILE